MKRIPLFLSLLLPGLLPLAAQSKADLADPQQRTSYALGLDIILTFRQQGIEVDTQALVAGIADTLAGSPRLTVEQKKAVIVELFKELGAKAEGERKLASVENLRAGRTFLSANARKEGVQVLAATAADGSAVEMQYEVLKSGKGSGASPRPGDIVEVHYEGSLTDGTVFDSSVQRATPATFGLGEVMFGWKAVLPKMKAGDKWRLFLPGPLAFGDAGPLPGLRNWAPTAR
jgi:FKBP-type peptidyl-prolyl cis-trans isomerase FklB